MRPHQTLIGLFLLSVAAHAQSVTIGSGATETVGVGATVKVPAGGVTINSGGTLVLSGTSASVQAKLNGPSSGTIGCNFSVSGTINFKFAKLTYIKTITVNAGGKIAKLHDTVFENANGWNPGTIPWLDLSALGASDRNNIAFSFHRVIFSDLQASPTRKNVKSGANTPITRLLGNTTSNNRWGATYEDDSSNRISWHTGQVTRTSPSGTFDTIEDAIKDGSTTASSIITVATASFGPNAYLDETIDWNWCSGSSGSGPTVLYACLAPMSGAAVVDSDGGTTARGVLKSGAVARGDVSETTLENETIFPVTGTQALSNTAATRVLIGSSVTQSGNTLTDCYSSAGSGFFVDSAGYNLHLILPGAEGAIDAAPAGTANNDWESDARGFDCPGISGAGTWDIGAEEYNPPAAPTGMAATTPANGQIAVDWANSGDPNLAGYYLERSGYSGGGYGHVPSAFYLHVVSDYTNSGLNNGSPYFYVARVVSTYGEASARSSEVSATATGTDTTTPDAPIIDTANNRKIRNQYPLTSGRAEPYTTVEVWIDSNSIGTTTAAANGTWSKTPTSPISEGAHTIKAKAKDAANNLSAYSNTINLTIDITAPAAPTNVKSIGWYTCIDVEWTASTSSDVVGYNVYRKVNGSGDPWDLLNTGGLVLGTKYRDSTCSAATTYTYKVVAYDDAKAGP